MATQSAQALIDDLTAARTGFFEALDAVDPTQVERPGLVGDWGARELVAHLGYWAGRVVDIIRALEDGRVEEAYEGQPPVDEVNATVARVAHETDLATVRKREAASVEALITELRRVDPALLDAALPSGWPLEALVREDGSDHYQGHTEDVRRAREAPADA
jgi:hypothetical protein